jgi:hypothetical protein
MILIKENEIVTCSEKDKQFYLNKGFEVVSNKKEPAKKDGEKANKADKTKDDEGKKLEGDLENL